MTTKLISSAPDPVSLYYTTAQDRWRAGRPLPVEGCMLVQCMAGEAELSINSRQFSLRHGMIAVFVFDMVIVVNRKSEDFAVRTVVAGFDVSQDVFFTATANNLWDALYASPVFEAGADMTELFDRWFDYVSQIELSLPEPIRNTIIRKEMENFFLITSLAYKTDSQKSQTATDKNRAWGLAIDFSGLLSRHYTRHHDVAYYASLLRITPNYLNIISRRYAGVSAKEQIKLQITLAVKNLLETTDLTVKGIADRLNFEDSSYLCRIFRKRTGMSPAEYRRQLRAFFSPEN